MNAQSYANNSKKWLPRLRSGVTLVELLVVLGVSVIVSGVSLSLYRLSSDYYLESEASLSRQRNLRVALYSLTRDIRMAGSGLFVLGPGLKIAHVYAPTMNGRACGQTPITANALGWYRNCDVAATESGARAIFAEDGGATGSDVITIFRAEPEFSDAIGEARYIDNWNLILSASITTDSYKPGDILGAVAFDKAALFEVESVPPSATTSSIKIKEGGRFTGPSGPPLGFALDGAPLYNLKNATLVTYYVDEATSTLMAVYHDQGVNPTDPTTSPSVPIADGVEDLQVYFFYEDETVDNAKIKLNPDFDSTKLDSRKVMAVTVALTAKAIDRRGPPQLRPALFNRPVGTVTERASRLSVLETVQMRNS